MGPEGWEGRVAASVDCTVAAKYLMDGPHGSNSHLSQPLTYLAIRSPDRLPLLVHRLKPQEAGEVRRARHLGERERIKGDRKQNRAAELLASQGGFKGLFYFFLAPSPNCPRPHPPSQRMMDALSGPV